MTLYSAHAQFKIGLAISAKQAEKLLRASGEGVGFVQPGEEKAPERPYSGLPVPKGVPTRKLGTDSLSGGVVIGQGGMALN